MFNIALVSICRYLEVWGIWIWKLDEIEGDFRSKRHIWLTVAMWDWEIERVEKVHSPSRPIWDHVFHKRIRMAEPYESSDRSHFS